MGSEIFLYVLPAELQKTLVRSKGLGIMLLTNRAYTKHHDIHDHEPFRKSRLLDSALQNPIQFLSAYLIMELVTASEIEISSLLSKR